MNESMTMNNKKTTQKPGQKTFILNVMEVVGSR